MTKKDNEKRKEKPHVCPKDIEIFMRSAQKRQKKIFFNDCENDK